jgi:hypothetical protein
MVGESTHIRQDTATGYLSAILGLFFTTQVKPEKAMKRLSSTSARSRHLEAV